MTSCMNYTKESVVGAIEYAKIQHELEKAKGNTFGDFSLPVRFFSREAVFKSSNFFFDPKTLYATSYGWYPLLKVIKGKLVLNNYYYSRSTIKHVIRLYRILDLLGIKIDYVIQAPQGLDDLDASVRHYERLIASVRQQLCNPRSKKALREVRLARLVELKKTLVVVKRLNK